MTTALKQFTFKTTGIGVALKPVSPLLSQKIIGAIPEPVPPMERVLSPDGTYRDEANPSHPDHAAALERHAKDVELKTRNLYIRLGVVLTLDPDQKVEVAALREAMAVDGIKLEDDDKVVYIAYIAIGSPGDYRDFIQAVTNASQPTDPKSQSGNESSTSDSDAALSGTSQPNAAA